MTKAPCQFLEASSRRKANAMVADLATAALVDSVSGKRRHVSQLDGEVPMKSMQDILENVTVLPVLEVHNAKHAAPLAEAFVESGLTTIELTMRSPAAPDILRAMRRAAPSLTIGMGTISTVATLDRAMDCEPDFLVTPGTTETLLEAILYCRKPILPGVSTATDAMRIYECGLTLMKFFPAEASGGAPYLKSLSGPLADLQFCPTGGISRDKVKDYLSLSNVVCVGASWVASKALIEKEDWSAIRENIKSVLP